MQKNITRLSFKPGTLPYTSWCKFLFLHPNSKWRIPEGCWYHHSLWASFLQEQYWCPLKKITSWISFCTLQYHSVKTLHLGACWRNPLWILGTAIVSIHSVPSWIHLAFHFFIFQMMRFEYMNSKLTWWTLLFIFCERNIFDYWFSYK